MVGVVICFIGLDEILRVGRSGRSRRSWGFVEKSSCGYTRIEAILVKVAITNYDC